MTRDIRTPAPTGLGLAPYTYTDPEWLAHEQELLFERSWTLVASVHELASRDAIIRVRVGRHPMLVRHDEDGVLRSFVASRTGEWALFPGSVAEWEGMVFVHPDADARSLGETLGAVPDNIGSFEPGRLVEVSRCELAGDFNWKLFVENHIDVYHLWYLHETSLGAFDHTKFEHRRLGANWVSYEPLKADVSRAPKLEGVVPIRHLDERDRNGIGAHMVFPNLLMASTAEFFATYAVYPVSPARSRIDLRIRAEPGADADALVDATRSFINEDIAACEGVQIALGSSRFGVGALAREHELPISEFHHDLCAVLGDP